ncbi:DUF86 domain-containing protein [Halorussus gelatinilyticus]|uniref:DUF86 domain-containing protein n=1 Tax=Halorussus gelatinilyticus TaxID=2937524 RepID=A0A8U0IFI3_9EURY|nr:DUF86 domain-containing protein [Halorussus gelatinilyticus]UPV98971.1 DUF86 domain-containing protein [Halorussus gelatinilyticus]
MTTDDFPTDKLNRILAAVETIEKSLGILASKQQLTREEYRSDIETQDIVERRFVKMTEASIDIAEVLAKYEQDQLPESNPKSMAILGDLGVLSEGTTEQMTQATRFRNVLSHTYGHIIDHDMVYTALQDLERYRTFVLEVRAYLDDIDALSD